MPLSHILIVGGGEESEALASALRRAGYSVIQWAGRPMAIKVKEVRPAAAIILPPSDNATSEDLLEVFRSVSLAPVIMMGESNELSIIRCLMLGADAYLPYPATPDMVLSYLTAIRRREESANSWLEWRFP